MPIIHQYIMNMEDNQLFLLIFILFIVLFILLVPYNYYLGIYINAGLSSIILFLLSYILILYSFLLKNSNNFYYIEFFRWFTLQDKDIQFSFYIDFLSLAFAGLTTNIGFLSIIYTFTYFRGEPNINKLITLINLFIISMLIFIFAKNIIVLYFGWELIGISSFLLINFWTLKIASLKSSFKAFFFNRFSDLFLLLFIISVFNLTQSIDINTINKIIEFYSIKKKYLSFSDRLSFYRLSEIELIYIFLILAASIKSAQIFGHLWLPDSMEAPVPASALIHSATLVSSGIYLILRFNSFIYISNESMGNFLFILGGITSMYGGFVAAYQNDIKRILAYSTISHCGNMMAIASIGGLSDYLIIYLYTHGYFKAICFFSSGNIIRFNKNIQDIRKMGMLAYYMPVDSLLLSISLLNLGGLPLTLGYYSKHYLILMLLNEKDYSAISLGIGAVIMSSVSGFLYSYRIIDNVVFSIKKGNIVHYYSKEQNNLVSNFFSSIPYISTIIILFSLINAYIILFLLHISINSFSNSFLENTFDSSINTYINSNSYIVAYYNNIILFNILILVLDFFFTFDSKKSINRIGVDSTIYIYIIPVFFLVSTCNSITF